jgi:hypothetical protein
LLITNLERLELVCQRMRSHRFESVEELREEVVRALDAILGHLKYLKRKETE